jgi:hypothetical protein
MLLIHTDAREDRRRVGCQEELEVVGRIELRHAAEPDRLFTKRLERLDSRRETERRDASFPRVGLPHSVRGRKIACGDQSSRAVIDAEGCSLLKSFAARLVYWALAGK